MTDIIICRTCRQEKPRYRPGRGLVAIAVWHKINGGTRPMLNGEKNINATYNEDHKEQLQEYFRDYRLRNVKKLRAKGYRDYWDNRDARLAQAKARNAENREERAQRYWDNREVLIERQRQYYALNRERSMHVPDNEKPINVIIHTNRKSRSVTDTIPKQTQRKRHGVVQAIRTCRRYRAVGNSNRWTCKAGSVRVANADSPRIGMRR